MRLRKVAGGMAWVGVALFIAGLLSGQQLLYQGGLVLAATGYAWVLTLKSRRL